MMERQLLALVLLGFTTATLAAPPPTNSTTVTSTAPSGAAVAPAPSKPDYPKDLGNGVEMINREDCPGGYCETFLVRPPPPGVQPMMGNTPCCPQLPPSPCGGQLQPSCALGPPPMGCNSPCPQQPPMIGR